MTFQVGAQLQYRVRISQYCSTILYSIVVATIVEGVSRSFLPLMESDCPSDRAQTSSSKYYRRTERSTLADRCHNIRTPRDAPQMVRGELALVRYENSDYNMAHAAKLDQLLGRSS